MSSGLEVVELTPTPEQLRYTFGGGGEPLLTVRPGTVVELATEDCFGGRVRTADDLPSQVCEFPYLNPVTGPIAVEGAEPGDTLAVEVLDLHTQGWGWTAILPGLGLLAGAALAVFVPAAAGAFLLARRTRRRPEPELVENVN